MDIKEYLDAAGAFISGNPVVAAVVGLILLYLMIRKTKLFLVVVLLCAILFGITVLIKTVSGKGGAAKTRMIEKTPTEDSK